MIRRRKIVQYGIAGFLCLFAVLYLFPYIWMVRCPSRRTRRSSQATSFPSTPTWEQYQRLFYGYKFKDLVLIIPYLTYYKNTVFVTVVSLFLVLLTDALRLMVLPSSISG